MTGISTIRVVMMVVPVMTSYIPGEHWTAPHHRHTTADLLKTLQRQAVVAAAREEESAE